MEAADRSCWASVETLEPRRLLAAAPVVGPQAIDAPGAAVERAQPSARNSPADITGRYIGRPIFQIDGRRVRRPVRLVITEENREGALRGTLSISRIGSFDVIGAIDGVRVDFIAVGPDTGLRFEGRIRAHGRFIEGTLTGTAEGRDLEGRLRVGRKARGEGFTDFATALGSPFFFVPPGFEFIPTINGEAEVASPTNRLFNQGRPVLGTTGDSIFDPPLLGADDNRIFPTSPTFPTSNLFGSTPVGPPTLNAVPQPLGPTGLLL